MKILAITGKRGGYEAMLPLYRALDASSFYKFRLIVCDQHLMDKFGHTATDIEFKADYIPPAFDRNFPLLDRAVNLSHYMGSYAQVFEAEQPDLLLLYGDRGEIAVAAIAATEMRIPVAHFQAGDVTGGVDDTYRKMITTSADYVFCSNRKARDSAEYWSKNRTQRPFEVGDQHLDLVRLEGLASTSRTQEVLGIHEEYFQGVPIALLLFHPETDLPISSVEQHMTEIIWATHEMSSINWIAIYPCSDPGYETVINHLETEAKAVDNFKVYKNLPQDVFHTLLSNAQFIAGNSSSGIIEAPFFNTPSVNIGGRQMGRLASKSVLNVRTYGREIYSAMFEASNYQGPYQQLYGDGTATTRIMSIFHDLFQAGEVE